MRYHVTANEGLRAADQTGEEHYAELLEHGSLVVGYYAPRGSDPQTPHTRDETYAIVTGSGRFRCHGDEIAVGPGDMLFVAAGEEHRFVDFTDDFGMWVFFYEPEGGEAQP